MKNNKVNRERDTQLKLNAIHQPATNSMPLPTPLSSEEKMKEAQGKLPAKDTHSTHGTQKIQCVHVGEVLNIDGIRSFIEKFNQRNDTKITDAQCQTMEQESEANRNGEKDKQKIEHLEHQSQKDLKRKDRELKLLKEKTKEERCIERENKRLKKQQKELERETKRREKEQSELKRKASIQRQAKLMERFLERKTNSTMENSVGHNSIKKTSSISSENTGELAVAATSKIDSILLQAYSLEVDKVWL